MKITKKEIKNLTNLYNNSSHQLFCEELKNTLKKLNFIRKAYTECIEVLENKEYFCVFNESCEQIWFAPKDDKKEAYHIFGDYLDNDDDIKIILENVGQ